MIVVIVGPTGVGKTKLSVELAKRFNGEVINADSMQVYKGLDIATAKIKEEEKEGIPHHLFDICEVEENFSVYDYQKLGREVSRAIIECPAIFSFLGQRDLSVLTNGNAGASELHMKACLRMTCAFIGLKDPFPGRKNAV